MNDVPPCTPLQALFLHPLRVYWEDTDAGGVVFYANYLKFFERARTEWLRARGVGQQTLREQTGAIFVVTESSVRYRLPALLDDALQVSVSTAVCSRARMDITQHAWRGSELLCEARIMIACIDSQRLRPRRIPEDILHQLTP
jgi:acyl-CoA thioester hydrolase